MYFKKWHSVLSLKANGDSAPLLAIRGRSDKTKQVGSVSGVCCLWRQKACPLKVRGHHSMLKCLIKTGPPTSCHVSSNLFTDETGCSGVIRPTEAGSDQLKGRVALFTFLFASFLVSPLPHPHHHQHHLLPPTLPLLFRVGPGERGGLTECICVCLCVHTFVNTVVFLQAAVRGPFVGSQTSRVALLQVD